MLYARYDLDRIRAEVDRDRLVERTANMWRFAELLPVDDPFNIVSLGEGGTPLIEVLNLGEKLGVSNLYVKEEGLNPTGTFKARGIAAAISKGLELGAAGFTMPSAGNAAGAAAAYCARCWASPPRSSCPRTRRTPTRRSASSPGLNSTSWTGLSATPAGRPWRSLRSKGCLIFQRSRSLTGPRAKKSMGLELAMQFGWRMPEAIIYPAGGGTGIIGMHKGFLELLELGWIQGRVAQVHCGTG